MANSCGHPIGLVPGAFDAGQTWWVIWAGYNHSLISEVRMRRLTNLDAAGGPTVGPEVALRPAGMGTDRVDAVLHDGDVWVSWTERTASTTYELMAARLSDLSTDSPILTDIASSGVAGQKSPREHRYPRRLAEDRGADPEAQDLLPQFRYELDARLWERGAQRQGPSLGRGARYRGDPRRGSERSQERCRQGLSLFEQRHWFSGYGAPCSKSKKQQEVLHYTRLL